MELRQLRYFAAVARERSFSKASEKLHIAQPALSRQIQSLEEELGTELLNRTARGVDMTEAGRRLKDMAEYVLSYIAEIKPTVSQVANVPSGHIVLGLPPSLASILAPRLVIETRRRFPLVNLRIIEGLSVFLSEWLEQSRLDLAVLTDYGPIAGIERHEVAEDDMVLVGTPAMLADHPARIALSRIGAFPLIIPRGFHTVLHARLQAEQVELACEMELDSIAIVKDMVLQGLYCSILSYSLVHGEVSSGRLRALRFEGAPIRRRIVAAVTANRPGSLTVRAIEDLIKQELNAYPLLLPDPA